MTCAVPVSLMLAPAPGSRRSDSYIPRQTTALVAAIRDEVIKRGQQKIPRASDVVANRQSRVANTTPAARSASRSTSGTPVQGI